MQENQTAGGTLWSELLSFSVYKRNQGRVTRQATFAALAITLAVGVWRLAQQLPLWLSSSSISFGTSGSAADMGVVRFLVPEIGRAHV